MRLVVTGANGFIGRALCATLASRGDEVTGVVRGGVPAPASCTRVVRLGERTDAETWRAAMLGADAVIHLAGRAHQGEGGDTRARSAFWQANVELTRSMLAGATAVGVPHVIFMSSSKVFGERSELDDVGQIIPFATDTVPAPRGPYGESKLAAEQILQAGCEIGRVQLTILRPPLVYGPGVGGNLGSLLRVVLRGAPLPFAAIRNQRSLIHRQHLIEIVMCALAQQAMGQRVFTLSDLEISTPALITMMARGLGVRARLFWFPVPGLKLLGWLSGRQAAISRLTESFVMDSVAIRQALQWQPTLDPDVAWQVIGAQFRAERSP